MEKVDLEQGSLDWLLHRQQHRNASESPALMRTSSFMTKKELWKEKQGIGKPFVGNVATDYGTATEPAARARVEELLELKLTSPVFVDGIYSASLDGYGEKATLTYSVEIKCPYQREASKLWKGGDEIPPQYYWQLVHQQMVCPTDEAYFFVYIDDETWRLIPFVMNQGDDLVLKAAWDDLYANPPVTERTDEDFGRLVAAHKDALEMKKSAETELKLIENAIKDVCEDDTEGFGMSVSEVTRKGTVDYKAVPELDGIDLESYRKKSSTYWKITHAKEGS